MKKKRSFFHSITPKLVIGGVLLVSFITFFTFNFIYRSAQETIFQTVQTSLQDMAAIGASSIDGDVVQKISTGEEDTTQFKQLREQLYEMRQGSPDIRYSYIMRPSVGRVEFVVDDTYGLEEDAAKIGEIYVNSEQPELQRRDEQEIRAGMLAPSNSSEIYEDQWGSFLSGYAPIYNSEGKAVAIYGLDIDASSLREKQLSITNQLYIQLGGVYLLACLLITWFALSFQRDLRQVNQSLRNILEHKDLLTPSLQRKDELGELNNSIQEIEKEIWAAVGRTVDKSDPHY